MGGGVSPFDISPGDTSTYCLDWHLPFQTAGAAGGEDPASCGNSASTLREEPSRFQVSRSQIPPQRGFGL